MGVSILVAGGKGQLGRSLASVAGADVDIVGAGSAELDVTDADSVDSAVENLVLRAQEAGRRPAVINAAAYTAVDRAETERARAFAVNALGPSLLATACVRHGVPLVHVSTDYVFAGDGDRPYEPGDVCAPRTVYGKSKLAGERSVLAICAEAWVVRTAWLYAPSANSFLDTMVRLEREKQTLSVVDDQRGSPTLAVDLAEGLLELARRVAQGEGPRERVLHCTGAGATTWYGFARAIFEELGADPERIRPCTTWEFPRPAPRPAYSVLSNDAWRAAGLPSMAPWRAALQRCLPRQRSMEVA
ncbi:dTDP-4-dehydrorhamnose reductase [Phytoactinopolyspora halotolerans]|nr:dTDP-4-dehydrorhamnose reductase [Phytoactinopolyspora halotolerans]